MKILLIALNSQYIHSNPALFYLKQAARTVEAKHDIQYRQWSINMSESAIIEELHHQKPDILAFSAYIWNIAFLGKLLADIRLLLPNTLLLAGGAEPSGHPAAVLKLLPELDALFVGEGENSWPQFLQQISDIHQRPQIPGLHWRENDQNRPIIPAPTTDLAQIPFLYTASDRAELAAESRIVYYESSRGCPYGCTFCASAKEPLRERPLETVLQELPLLAETGGQIKFIDRTFNAAPHRATAIIEAILKLYKPGLSWHFELSPYALTEQMLELLCSAPKDYFHLEAGVQSLNKQSLAAVGRHDDWPKAKQALTRLIEAGNCQLHLDLIAGLPHETPQSFALAFDELHRLYPDYLQLGFLKILPGSLLEEDSANYGLLYSRRAPYQILSTPTMDADYLFSLHHAERALNAFYNKGHFRHTLQAAAAIWPGGALALYYALAAAIKDKPSGIGLKAKTAVLEQLLLPLDKQKFTALLLADNQIS